MSVTAALAFLGAVLATVSLTWQFATYKLSGPRVATELLHGALRGAQAVTSPLSVPLSSIGDQGFDERIFAVRATNRGRMTAIVQDFAIEVPSGASFGYPGWRLNPGLPQRLEPGAQAMFMIPAEYIDRLVALDTSQTDGRKRIRGRVGLGTGKLVRTKFERWSASEDDSRVAPKPS